jgi:nucleotide-binding universal stress UspA family protein
MLDSKGSANPATATGTGTAAATTQPHPPRPPPPEHRDPRNPSIQFLDGAGGPTARPKTSGTAASAGGRRPSPPPAPKFENRVSFDTFEKRGDAASTTTSFAVVRKHVDFRYSKSSRTFLCGVDDNDYSDYALEWLIDELVDDGDEVVCLRVVDKDSTIAASTSLENLTYRAEAEKLMAAIQAKNHENKAINLILEFAVGKPEKVIMTMVRPRRHRSILLTPPQIKLYEPALLIVGTKGRNLGGIQGLLPGSVSKYCLQNSPVPVIVVRPNSQRAHSRRKRRPHDPAQNYYRDLLERADPDGDGPGGGPPDDVMFESEDEAAQVAKAIGVEPTPRAEVLGKASPLSQVQSAWDGKGKKAGSPPAKAEES